MIRIGSFVIFVAVAIVLMSFSEGAVSYADSCCGVKQVSDTSGETCKTCGKAVDSKVDGENVAFCCDRCASDYKENPDKYSHHEEKRESYREKYQSKEPKKRQRGEGYY